MVGPQLIPSLFKKSLDNFIAEKQEAKRADIVLVVKQGRPKEGSVVLASGALMVHAGSSDAMVFCTRKPKCALTFSHGSGQATLHVYEHKELACPELSEQARVLFRMMFEEAAASKGIISLHASTFVWNGQAFCVTGPSGSGKSTLTKNWLKAVPKSYVLNGDRPIIQLIDGLPFACGAPWSGTENIFINENAPLRAIVEVKKHCLNRIQRLDPRRAYTLLLKRVSKPQWNGEATGAVIEIIAIIVSKIPVYRCYCQDTLTAGEFLGSALITDANGISFIPEGEKEMKIKKGFVIRKVLEDYMAVPLGADSTAAQGAVMLNETGLFLWKKLQQPTTKEALLENILSEFAVNKKTVLEDLNEFLESLRKANVLEDD